jgi:hypothetical protein
MKMTTTTALAAVPTITPAQTPAAPQATAPAAAPAQVPTAAATKDRLDEARWIFERQLAWISAAEVKVGVVVTIQVAMLAGLGAAFAAATKKSPWALGSCTACVLLAAVAIICAAMAVKPRTDGPASSLLFFGKVRGLSEPDYAQRFKTATDEDLLADYSAQIHRNAEIASAKHDWVGKAVMISFMSAIPWLSAIGLLTF